MLWPSGRDSEQTSKEARRTQTNWTSTRKIDSGDEDLLRSCKNKMEWKCSLILSLPWTQIIYNLRITLWGWIGGGGVGLGGQRIGSYIYGYVSLSGTQFLPSTVL